MLFGLLYAYFLIFTTGLEFTKFPSAGPPPSPRKGVVMEAVPFYSSIIVFGGYESHEKLYNDIWQFNASSNSWNEMFSTNQDSPVERYSGGGFYRYKSREYCIWGGNSLQGQLNDIWCFHLLFFTWSKIETSRDVIVDPRYKIGCTSWNETGTTMFAIFGGISMAQTSSSLFILNTDTWTWESQKYQGDLPGAQEDPILAYYSGYLYMVGGRATYNANPYASAFYRYNLSSQSWENITNTNKIFTYRVHAKGALIGNVFFLAFGLNPITNEELNTVYKVSLEDPDFAWSLAQISSDQSDKIRRDSYGFGVLGHKAYLFGGTRDQVQRSSLAIFDLDTHPIQYKYYSGYDSPGPRMYHSMNLVGGYLLLFGGENGSEKFNDLWRLDTITLTWEFINAGGDIPPARSKHASSSNGDILIIWGGNSDQGYLNDAYIYNSLTNSWYLVDYNSGTVPSPRIGACMGMDYSTIFIYGGMTNNGLSDELWYLNLGTKTYKLLDSQNSQGPGTLVYASCRFSSNRNFKFSLYGGIGENEVPSNGYYSFFKSTLNWTKLYHDQTDLKYARGNTKILKMLSRYVILGGEGIENPDKNCYYFNSSTAEFYSLGQLPSYIFASAQEYLGDKIYIHGGGGVFGDNLRRSVPVNTQIYIDLTSACSPDEFCYWKYCTPGTYLYNDTCAICPSGTYQPYYGGNCLPCPKGTYYSGIGATSIDQCYPCDEGTYNGAEGASYCIDCPSSSSCPTGSSTYNIETSTEKDISIQPNLLEDRSKDSREYSSNIQIAIAAVGFTILLILAILANRMNLFTKIDLYSGQHNHLLNTPMYLRNTKIGGFFSLIFIILAVMIIISLLVDFSINNITETKTLVPLVVMNKEVSKFITDMTTIISIMHYGAPCVDDYGNCADTIGITYTNFEGSWSKLLCSNKDQKCELSITCTDCEINSGAKMDFQFTNSSSYSAGWMVTVSSNSSVPGSLSSYQSSLYPESGKIFRGPSPSILNFDLTPSYYKNTDSGLDLTGYHVSTYGTQTSGSQYTTKELATSYDLYLEINFLKASNCLITARSSKQTLVQLISALLGSVFGLLGSVGGLMGIAEKKMIKIAQIKGKKAKHDKLAEDGEKIESSLSSIHSPRFNEKYNDEEINRTDHTIVLF